MISCLTITRPARLPLLREAVADFTRQTHADRELLIVHDAAPGFDDALRRLIATCPASVRARILCREAPPGATLGALRNLSVSLAQGDVVCQWDDDDRHHPRRLERQLDCLARHDAAACFLVDQLHLFTDAKTLFWDDWDREAYPMNLIPGSLLGRRMLLPPYPDVSRGEDSGLVVGLLRSGQKIARLRGEGWLLVYRFHGGNTFDAAHHQAIAKLKHVNAAKVLSRENRLRERLAEFDPPLGPMTMPHEAGQVRFP